MNETEAVSMKGERLDAIARVARKYSQVSIDNRSSFNVGAAVCLSIDDKGEIFERYKDEFEDEETKLRSRNRGILNPIYPGCNFNLSGMQVKEHAEQLALKKALMDVKSFGMKEEADLKNIIVFTSSHKRELVCGNCLQVARTVCNFLSTDPDNVRCIGADVNNEGEEWYTYRRKTLSNLLPETYAEK